MVIQVTLSSAGVRAELAGARTKPSAPFVSGKLSDAWG